jgi:hypothetical protein
MPAAAFPTAAASAELSLERIGFMPQLSNSDRRIASIKPQENQASSTLQGIQRA